jgi:hypothetical protein
MNQPTTANIFAIANYLGMSPNALFSSSDPPELSKNSKYTSDKDKVIAVQEELIQKYKQENAELRQMLEGVQLTKKIRQKPYAKEWEERKQKKDGRRLGKKLKTPSPSSRKKRKLDF